MTVADPIETEAFPVTPRNRVKRVHERGRYDRETVFGILDSAVYCHVAYAIDGQPFATPTLHWRKGDILYWHGSSASRMLRHLKVGTPACLTVSHIDRLVLARSGFNHSVDYRAAMCFGTAHIVDDPAEKAEEMRAVVDRLFPDRTAALRQTSVQEAKATTIIKMQIEDASAKIRAKGVGDDEEDYAHPVWAGTIALRTLIDRTEDCPRQLPDARKPSYLDIYREGRPLEDALLETQTIYEEDLERRGL
jgi:nitroimidazol reductase NimA-like FMN-containing flavoprotein (pyridoxamine 5'-phosphate oxidase superfamily)